MQISPRDGSKPIIQLDGPPSAIAEPLLRQRRRLADVFRSLTPDQWAAPSRCAEWRVQDVAAHLIGVDQFWHLSITSGLAGTPTRFLETFDPKATPAAMVDGVRGLAPAEVLASYLEACDGLCATVEALDDSSWDAIGESPAGHVTMTALGHHALWDCWIHERDVLLPLGLPQDEEPDEILASLRYAAAIGPALMLQASPPAGAAVVLDVTGPDARVVVTVSDHVAVTCGSAPDGTVAVAGDAVELLEALSVRAPWPCALPDEHARLFAVLAEVFEGNSA